MRLDLFLKASRLVIRRSQAQALADAGEVLVNGVTAKPSRAIKAGDEIRISRGPRILTVRVKSIPATKQTSRAAAADLYDIVSDEANPLGFHVNQE